MEKYEDLNPNEQLEFLESEREMLIERQDKLIEEKKKEIEDGEEETLQKRMAEADDRERDLNEVWREPDFEPEL